MLEFVKVVLTISCVAAAPILIVADNSGWGALFGEDEM